MRQAKFVSGFVALLGRPNAGKSSLLNALVGTKISIISPIPQTTRHQIRGILNLKNAQIVFVDTPGIHSFNDTLSRHLNTVAKKSLEGIDLVIYVVDASRAPGKEEERLTHILAGQKQNIIMVLNKIDLGRNYLNTHIGLWQDLLQKGRASCSLLYYIPVSAVKGTNIDNLKKTLVENLPEGCAYYDKDVPTDFPLKFRLADIIREKLFLHLKKEVPHSLAVEVSQIEDKAKSIYIRVTIYVLRSSQKAIVIGKGAISLKEVGVLSRRDIEKVCSKKVFLDIRIKVMKDWQERPRILKELGYWWA
jgi:GTP-binding protein Era